MKRTGIHQRRQQLRHHYWPNDDPWLGPKEPSGWFTASRTLPLILNLLDSKPVGSVGELVEK